MSLSRLSDECAGMEGVFAFGPVEEPPDHDACPGGYSQPGLIGGWSCSCECHRRPSPGVLWTQADSEHPDDADCRRARYRELMIEHGHLIPGKPEPLPCGWSPEVDRG